MSTRPRGIHPTARRARPLVAAAAVAVVLTTAACSSGSGGSSASGSSSGGPTAEQLTKLQSLVDTAKKVPPYKAPGPAVNLSSLAGKKVMVIPTASQLPVCDQIGKDIAGLAKEVGMTGTYFENSGGPQGWIPGMQQAVSQNYNAIVLVCGIDPNLIKPQVKAATDAGIAVIDSGLYDTQDGGTDPLVTAQTNIPNAESIRRSVDVAFLDNKQKPFDAVMVTSDEVPAGVKMGKAIEDEFKTYCPGCHIQKVNVAIPDWGTKIQGEVSSALLANPNIKAVLPIFDGMVPPAGAAVTASNKKDVFLYADYGGTPAYIKQMGGSIPMHSDTGPTHLWRAYATSDQMFRVLTTGKGLDPNAAFDPHRLWTLDNKGDITGPNDGFGTDFVTGYRKLWGLK
jgi:ribose transport system substrate-binding protein